MTHLPVLADVAAAAEHCSYCPKMCRFACPVAEATGRESVTPWGIDRVIAAMARGEQLTAAEQAPVWACTGCRQCGGACAPGLDLPSHVRAARAHAARPAGIDEAAGREHAPDPPLRAGATAGAPTLVYPGCRSQGAAALAGVLAAAGVEYAVVDADSCCGARDADLGDAETAAQRVEDLRGRFDGVDRVVVADPHCARWLAWDHADDRVRTVTAYLAEILDRLVVTAPPQTATWHDPCWLGRGMTEYSPGRAVVATMSGRPVVEAEHHADRAWCAGGGMGYAQADPAGAAEILRRRVAELAETGADVVVTSCPVAAARLASAGLDAYDLPQYVAARVQGAS